MSVYNIILFLSDLKLLFKRLKKNKAEAKDLNSVGTKYNQLIINLSPKQQHLLHTISYTIAGFNKEAKAYLSDLLRFHNKQVACSIIEQKEKVDDAYGNFAPFLPLTELALTLDKYYSIDAIGVDYIKLAKSLSAICASVEDSIDYLKTYYQNKKQNSDTKNFKNACRTIYAPNTSLYTVSAWQKLFKKNNWQDLMENKNFVGVVVNAEELETVLRTAALKSKLYPDAAFPFIEFKDEKFLAEYWHNYAQSLEFFDKKDEQDFLTFSRCRKPGEGSKIIEWEATQNKFIREKLNFKLKESAIYFQNFLLNCPLALLTKECKKLYNENSIPEREEHAEARAIFAQQGMTSFFHRYRSLCPQDSEQIPNLCIDQNQLGFETKYYLMKLPSNDIRATYLGNITYCCQNISDHYGKNLVITGINYPNCGFYVICERQGENSNSATDPIVAQTWAGRNNNMLILNSIVPLYQTGQGIKKINDNHYTNLDIWKALFRVLAQTIINTPKYRISHVMTGTDAPSTIEGLGLSAEPIFGLAKRPSDLIGIKLSGSFNTQVELAVRDFPLFELYVLTQHTPLQEGNGKKTASENFHQYIDNPAGFEKLCTLIRGCQPNDHGLAMLHMLHDLSQGSSICDEQKKPLGELIDQNFSTPNNASRWLFSALTKASFIHFKWCVEHYNLSLPVINSLKKHITVLGDTLNDSLFNGAVENKNLELFQYLLEKITDKSQLYSNETGMTILFKAIEKKDEQMFHFIMDLPYDLDHPNNGNVLQFAAGCNFWNVVPRLLQIHAKKPSLNTQSFNNFLRTAINNDKATIKTVIFSDWFDWYNLPDDLLNELLPSFDLVDDQGNTFLHYFLESNEYYKTAKLLKLGINIHIPNHEGNTALHLIAIHKRWDLLLECANDTMYFDVPNLDNNTVLHFVAEAKQWKVLKHLVSLGASFTVENNSKRTVLDIVEAAGEYHTFAFLEGKSTSQILWIPSFNKPQIQGIEEVVCENTSNNSFTVSMHL
jgi:ankyrin repeat protein